MRAQIERIFSALSCFGGGLGPLPAWVRRIDHVRRWVTAKVVIVAAMRKLLTILNAMIRDRLEWSQLKIVQNLSLW